MSIRDITQIVYKNVVVKEIQYDILFAEKIESMSFFFKFLIKSYFPL